MNHKAFVVLAALKRMERCQDCIKKDTCKRYPYWDRERHQPKLCFEKEVNLSIERR